MNIDVSNVFARNYRSPERVLVNVGGTSSSKTYSLCQIIAMDALNDRGSITTVAAQSYPALRKGALRDFKAVCQHPEIKRHLSRHNLSTNTFVFNNGSVVEFSSFADADSAKHGKRQRLFLNEADSIPYAVAQQLIMRTSKRVYIDFNPTQEFWAHDHYRKDPNTRWHHSTYRDNPFIDPAIVAEIESLKDKDPELYKVYGLGILGNLSGQVYPNVRWIDKLPDGLNYIYAMDIGFSNSVTTLVKMAINGDNMYMQELLYTRGLNDRQIGEYLKSIGLHRDDLIVIDSANQSTIDFLSDEYGLNTVACKKRSVINEIAAMKRYNMYITDDSINFKKEQKNYLYQKDRKDNSILNAPVKAYDHLWDAARYGMLELTEGNSIGFL
jgi:phage terminase large subunit